MSLLARLQNEQVLVQALGKKIVVPAIWILYIRFSNGLSGK